MVFREFDSMEAMWEFMREQERLANENTADWQRAIGYGDYWMRMYEEILIFGYVNTLDELDAIERELGVEDDELAFERSMISNAHERGYRYGKAYSVVEPDGEWGSTHVSTMIPISREMFEAARECGWTHLADNTKGGDR